MEADFIFSHFIQRRQDRAFRRLKVLDTSGVYEAVVLLIGYGDSKQKVGFFF